MSATATIPLSLYLHFPWCVKKCPYCDFNSHTLDGGLPEDAYIEALNRDLRLQSGTDRGRPLESVFMGGGTPSLFSPAAINRLLTDIGTQFDLSGSEVTLEANPGTFDAGHFHGYRQAGVNRISIGVQSFDDRKLAVLGRIHQGKDAEQAYKGAQQAGFSRINLDLMYGLPDQTIDEALADLQAAVDLGPEHLSWYQLTIEPNTVFYNRPPSLPDMDEINEMMDAGFNLLKSAGYQRYEISAFAKPGGQARHNLNYWQFGDYLGVGAGAHGKRTRDDVILRTTKTRVPADYLSKPDVTRTVEVPADQRVTEYLMNTLRLADGFDSRDYETRTGLGTDTLQPFLARAVARQLIDIDGSRIRPTERGLDFLNESLLLIDEH